MRPLPCNGERSTAGATRPYLGFAVFVRGPPRCSHSQARRGVGAHWPAPAMVICCGCFASWQDPECFTVAILEIPLVAMTLLHIDHQLTKRSGRVGRFGGKLSPQHIAERPVGDLMA